MSTVPRNTDDIAMGSTDTYPTSPTTMHQPFTKAERIQQLNDIDRSITRLLQSAGLAIKTLTAHHAPNDASTNPELENRRNIFITATDSYLQSLHSVDVRLKRQILGLEEAGIVAHELDSDQDKTNGNADTKSNLEKKSNLDVGWLNSRSAKVERDMEAELWANARSFLESMDIEDKEDGTMKEDNVR